MSVRRLDVDAKPIVPPSRRKAATRHSGGAREYHYSIRYRSPDGRQREKRAWLRDDVAAAALEARLRGRGSDVDLPWSEAIAAFVEAHAAHRSESYLGEIGRLRTRWLDGAGDPPVGQTSRATFANYLAKRAASKSGRAAQKDRATLLSIARWCRGQGLVETLPFEHVPRPEHAATVRQPATVEEFEAIAAVLPPWMGPLWRALGYTGSRWGGMAGLLEIDVGDAHVTTHTKRGQVVRYAVAPQLAQAIEQARQHKRATGMTSDLVFVTQRGHRWDNRYWSRNLKRYCRLHGVPYRTPHQLRHMVGSLAAEAGLSADVIQAMMGHQKRSTSERYIHHGQGLADAGFAALHRTCFAHNDAQAGDTGGCGVVGRDAQRRTLVCPRCGHKFNPDMDKGQKP